MSEDLGMQVTRLLLAERPGLLSTDVKSNAEACVALAGVLGCLLATVKQTRGQAYYEDAARVVFARIDQYATATHRMAGDIAEQGVPASH